MPGLNGIDLMREVRSTTPHTRLIALSMQTDRARVIAALQAGAGAYVDKSAAFKELTVAIDAVMQRRRYLSATLETEVLETLLHPATATPPPPRLTPQESAIVQLIVEEHANKDIADRLCLSVRTVEWHRARIMDKLGVSSLVGLLKHALQTQHDCGIASRRPQTSTFP